MFCLVRMSSYLLCRVEVVKGCLLLVSSLLVGSGCGGLSKVL